jgi:hypothetical protein
MSFTGFELAEQCLIDYIFLHDMGEKCTAKVVQHGQASDFWDGRYPPSDHRPVIADLAFFACRKS